MIIWMNWNTGKSSKSDLQLYCIQWNWLYFLNKQISINSIDANNIIIKWSFTVSVLKLPNFCILFFIQGSILDIFIFLYFYSCCCCCCFCYSYKKSNFSCYWFSYVSTINMHYALRLVSADIQRCSKNKFIQNSTNNKTQNELIYTEKKCVRHEMKTKTERKEHKDNKNNHFMCMHLSKCSKFKIHRFWRNT